MVEVRQATAADADLWRSLRRYGIARYPAAFRMTLPEHDAIRVEDDAARLAEGGRFLALDRGTPIGSIGLYQNTEGGMTHRGVVFGMYVMPEAQGTGVAGALLRQVVTHAGELRITQLELDVNEANTRAVAFYLREGFTQYGRLPNAVIGANGPEHDLMLLRILPHPS